MNVEALKQAGIDYEKGVQRFMGDEPLYQLVLTTFLQDETLEMASRQFSDKDYGALLRSAHAIKGASGNADMVALYAASSALVLQLRMQQPDDNAISDGFVAFERAYITVKEGILQAMAG